MALNKVEICGVDTSTLPVLTNERMRELFPLVHGGDLTAREEFVRGNLRLVLSVIQRFGGRGENVDDLFQVGCIGLIKALDNFDVTQNVRFSTYAVPMIIGEIRRSLRDDGIIKVSRALKQDGSRILRAREAFCREFGREPQTSELAQRCEMTESELVYALEAVSPIRSFEEPIGEEEGMTLESVLPDQNNEIERLTERIALRQAIATLSPLQQQILQLRYGKELSQEQTGQLLGMTQVKISREEKKIMLTLRKML